jgi:HK97 family phage portal protein
MLNKLFKLFGKKIVSLSGSTSGVWHSISSFFNTSKENVTNETALTVSTVYACIRNVSEDIAKMPIKVYIKEGESRFEQQNNRIWQLLNLRPNPDMTGMSLREAINGQAMGWGNGYAYIERFIDGTPKYLWPLRPDRVTVRYTLDTDELYYEVLDDNGSPQPIMPNNMIHIHGLGSNGVSGYNIVALMSQSIGAGIAMDKFAGSYFGNGLHSGGNLEHPENLSTEAQGRLKQQIEDQLQGSDHAFNLLVLEEGMKFAQTVIDPKASQMIETRQFTVTEFCRWMRVPPHKVADLSRATFSNIEQQNIDYVTDSLLGWMTRWEIEIALKLFTEDERDQGYFVEHITEVLLRGDIKTRYEAYALLWDRGALSPNEIRKLENMNPISGGDQYFVPMNFTTLENAGNDIVDPVVMDVSNRLAKAEISELEKHVVHAKDDTGRFKEWLEKFYSKHDSYICSAVAVFKLDSSYTDLMSMKTFMMASDSPEQLLRRLKDNHANYIAQNLRSYINEK